MISQTKCQSKHYLAFVFLSEYARDPSMADLFDGNPTAGTLGYFTEEVAISYEGLLSRLVSTLKAEGFLPEEVVIVFQLNMTIGDLLDQCSAHLGTAA